MLLLAPLLSASLESNIVNAARSLMHSMNIKASNSGVKEKLQEHPDYPSLLSISDVLTNWNISNISTRADREMLEGIRTPFMVQMKDAGGFYFVVVRSLNRNGLEISDRFSQKWKTIDWKNFLEAWTGIVTITEPGENAGEPEYAQKRKKELLRKSINLFVPGIILLIVAYTCGNTILNWGWAAWPGISMLLLKLFGVYATGFLLWYEIDKNNLAIQKVCKADKKKNCHAILQSKASKFRGLVSWSEIGFAYFTGGLAFIVLNGISTGTIALMAACSLLALPYILFSLFYQWQIAKQWCLLCVTVQAILGAEIITALFGNVYAATILNQLVAEQALMLPVYFALPLVSWLTIKPVLKAARENKQSKLALNRLKHNRQIFESQLVRQKKVLNDTNSIGLILGNRNAKNKIIKVCNPYCGPCAKAHPDVHQLIEHFPDLQVQIIFTATGSEKDTKAPPVRHLLAISEECDPATLDEALSYWYASTEKNYDSFAAKFPVKGEIDKYNDKLNEMAEWCKANGISYTPTFFVNSFELPEMYEISSMKYLLT
jgi:thiol-disulfide isomerase/thioredoxin